MKLYDTIFLKKLIDAVPISVGTRGVILMEFDSPRKAFEIELFNESGESLGTYTVSEDQIEKREH